MLSTLFCIIYVPGYALYNVSFDVFRRGRYYFHIGGDHAAFFDRIGFACA